MIVSASSSKDQKDRMGRQEVAMVVEISGKGKHRGAAMYAEPLNSAAIGRIGHHTKSVQLMQVHPSAAPRLGWRVEESNLIGGKIS